MFQRQISTEEVEFVLKYGEVIKEYPKDKPLPSRLIFAVYKRRPLHVVCSIDSVEKIIIIITAYEPALEIWTNNFKKRKKD